MAKSNKNSIHEDLIKSVSKLCVQYIDKYQDQVLGIYLSPYRVGGKQRIEVVIVDNAANEKKPIELNEKETNINDLKIVFNTNPVNFYKKRASSYNYKLLRDLNYGSIVYDTKGKLSLIKSTAHNDENIVKPFNSYELPAGVPKLLKKRIYSFSRKKN